MAPHRPIGAAAVSSLRPPLSAPGRRPGAAARIPHPAALGVQRLVDANLDLKTIGDFIGHRSPRSTEIYAKVDVEALRQVALGGDGEQVLA